MKRKTYIPFEAATDHSISYLLGILEDARMTTLERIAHISIDELHWQFQSGWNSIGILLSHIISCEHFHRIKFVEGRQLTQKEENEYWPGIEMGKHIPNLITDWTVDEYIARLEVSRRSIVEQIQKLDVSDFHKRREGYNPKTGYNLAWTLYHLAEDEVHHRGQISMIRKLYKAR